MNILSILADIEHVDPEVYDRLDSRRAVFRHLTGLGQKLTAAALPLAVGAVFNKAYAQSPVGASVAEVLNFALRLEYLEAYFYALRPLPGIFSVANVNPDTMALIATDERNHVQFLRTVIGSLGATPVADPGASTFDFTAGKGSNAGDFSGYNRNVTIFLTLAQLFEDLGVRAYKGAAPLLATNKAVLTAALNIHSVEARHASQIRTLRRGLAFGSATPSQVTPVAPYTTVPKSWISGTDNGGPVPTYSAAIYNAGNNTGATASISFPAENNTVQGGINLANLPGASAFPASAFSEAFDEGLDVGTVSAIAKTFVVATSSFFS